MINDKQIKYLNFIIHQTKAKAFYKDEGDLIPIRAIDLRHGEFSGDAPEPVIILGGTKVGKCSSLNLIDIEDIEIQPDIAKWPE